MIKNHLLKLLRKECSFNKIVIISALTVCISINSYQSVFALDSKNADSNSTVSTEKTDLQDENQESPKYSMKDLNSLSNKELIDTLRKIQYEDISDLYELNEDSYEFYKDQDRVQAIIDAIVESGSTYTDSDTKGLLTLAEVIKAGNYVSFCNKNNNDKKDIDYLCSEEFYNKCIPAMLSIERNKYFGLGTDVQNEVVTALGRLITNTTCNAEVVNNAANILKQYNENVDTYISDFSKGTALTELMNGILKSFRRNITFVNSPEESIWYGNIDAYIDELEKMVLVENLNKDNAWLVNNGIYQVSQCGKLHSNPNTALKVLTKALDVYPYLGEQYLEAADGISNNLGGKDYNGKTIDYNEIIETAKNHYLPKTYTFDDGKMIIKAGDKVSEEKIQRLYWAAKEVEAQFFRNIKSDKALEPGNADDTLTMVIYNSPDEYKMNLKLYGYETNNGGIYIEEIGTFFTYERTPEQSIYSLEELFRHEFTHYLQGRYVVPGLFNKSEIQENERLTWFSEGGAEFFAGSTRTSSVLPRQSMLRGLSSNPVDRYTVSKTLHSKYGSFDFYNYAFAFDSYLYENNLEAFNKLNEYVKANDVAGYDNYINALSNDSELNKEYQLYMQQLVDNYDNLTVPLVSDDYLNEYPHKDIKDICSDITSVIGLKNVTSNEENSQFFDTFTIKGTYSGEISKGELDDWKLMDKTANEFLKTLSDKDWAGYDTLTCYFTNYRVNSSNKFEFDVVFHGKQGQKNFVPNKLPTAVINGPYTVKEGTEVNFSSSNTTDEDGNIVSYLWDFGDGETSTEANPSHKYKIPGTYTVTLKVTDDRRGTDVKTTTATVEEVSAGSIDEIEQNDSFETATQIPGSNVKVNGELKGINSVFDSRDYYYFDVTSPGEIDIFMNNLSNEQISWRLYHESDNSTFIDGDNVEKSDLRSLNLEKTGRYYILFSKRLSEPSSYSFILRGDIIKSSSNMTDGEQEDKDSELTNENESNNSFDTANEIVFSKDVTTAKMDSKDGTDIFYFDVTSPAKIKITVDNSQNLGINWLLYKESDLSNYVDFAKPNELKLESEYDTEPGRYYLQVYNYSDDTNGSYTVNIQSSDN